MDQKNINYPAMRALHRAFQPVSDSLDEGYACDSHFDGGEWSGPAYAVYFEEAFQDTAESIGARFGMTRDEAIDHYACYIHENSHRSLVAMQEGA